MSLKDKILAANAIYLDPDRMGDEAYFYPGGVADRREAVNVIWDAAGLQGTNQEQGDSINLESDGGRRIRETVIIECPVTLDVDDTRVPPDLFRLKDTNELAAVKRITGRDSALMSVLCVRTKELNTRRPSRRG